MSEKKYYWIKLKTDFFDLPTIDYLLEQKNGSDYVILYQKLCLITANNNGELTRNIGEMIIPYDAEKISQITKFDIDTVVVGMNLFQKLGLIYEQDNSILKILNFNNMVGSETQWAEKKRKYIENKLPPVEVIKRLNKEMIRLPNGKTKFIDEKRHGGNGGLTYDLANCQCENCGTDDSDKLVIHHHNGYSNYIEDLYLLCTECHGKVEAGKIKIKHNRGGKIPPKSRLQSLDKRLEIENRDKSIDIDIYNYIEYNYGRLLTPIEYEKVKSWLSFYEEDIIKYAIDIAVLNGKKTISYLIGILQNWKGNNFTTLEEIKSSKKTKEVPEWFNKKIENKEISKEEQEELNKILNEIGE